MRADRGWVSEHLWAVGPQAALDEIRRRYHWAGAWRCGEQIIERKTA